MDAQRLGPGGRIEVEDAAHVADDPGVGESDVEPAETVLCGRDQLRDIGLDPGIDLQRADLPARVLPGLGGINNPRRLVTPQELRALGGDADHARAPPRAASPGEQTALSN